MRLTSHPFFILTLLFGLLFFEPVAQNTNGISYGSRFNAMQWTEANGIPPIVNVIAQTPDGFLWAGNESGIFRFDGVKATQFNRHSVKELTEDDCMAMCVAADSSLYCGMYNGLLVRYSHGRFEKICDKNDFDSKSIFTIVEDKDGCLWIGTDGAGLLKYQHGRIEKAAVTGGKLPAGIQCMARGKDNSIWLGSRKGLLCIKNGTIKPFKTIPEMEKKGINSLFCDHAGRLWIGTQDGDVFVHHKDEFSQVKSLRPIAGSPVNAFEEDPDGKIWILSYEFGVKVYDPATDMLSPMDVDPLLTESNGTDILIDQEGDVIISTQGASIFRLRKNLLRSYTTADGLPDNSVMGIYKSPSKEIWIGSESGKISRYFQEKFTDQSHRFGVNGRPVFSIGSEAGKSIMVATVGELCISDGQKKRVIHAGQYLLNTLFHAVYSSDGTVWAGTDAGIMTIKDGEIKTIRKSDGLSDDKVFCFHEDAEGGIWVGTQEGGINIIKAGKIKQITRSDGLSDNLILCFYQDSSGTMWVGTGHDGLNRIDAHSGEIAQIGAALNYPQAITHIAEDKAGILWMGTGDGIIAVKRSDLDDYAAGRLTDVRVSYFGPAEGMTAGGCPGGVFPAGVTTSEGKIWFTSLVGITEVDPENMKLPSYSPKVVIQDLLVNNTSMGVSGNYVIPAGALEMEICYTAPSFIMPEDLRFRYKMDGIDEQWVTAKTRRSAYYNNLPPGNYTFHIQAMNHHGQWGEQMQSIQIRIKPFFYQTIWFILLLIAVVVAVFYFILKYRLRQVRQKELEHLVRERTEEIRKLNEGLEQKVVERTAQLGATNAELEAFSYSVSHDLKAPVRRIEGLIVALQEDYGERLDGPARDFLAKIVDSVSTMSLLIDELLKLSRIARQELERTDVNLSSMIQKILEKLVAGIPDRKVIFNVQPNLVVDCDARLVQIALQNLLDNAIKYSGKREIAEITAGIEILEGKPTVFIRDNGVGFDMNHYNKLFTPFQRLHSDDQFTGTGIGLATVRRIIQKHGGTIWAESEPGSGTTFYFTVK